MSRSRILTMTTSRISSMSRSEISTMNETWKMSHDRNLAGNMIDRFLWLPYGPRQPGCNAMQS